jgi:hypothetical protein
MNREWALWTGIIIFLLFIIAALLAWATYAADKITLTCSGTVPYSLVCKPAKPVF